ncbi:hypothetical protein P153DRAFT_156464 [Dothidotthia symphoricarpi CBS 119687]|uniref:Uncharacterized protein n=1 Tax=Dothidotthia symphoricarpi CBS 119687 TaxID=1392245 RepID=A0A6A6ASA8_9PLEO|nr:uncharacterized protein P153DRAFT_156464 [Dothidotthia symphoricarpi CBS 119687]KAF2133411.1 hypothetical protein P153DRAFT_156464 [Dothidotthia symphoricarpi CBS 119687]
MTTSAIARRTRLVATNSPIRFQGSKRNVPRTFAPRAEPTAKPSHAVPSSPTPAIKQEERGDSMPLMPASPPPAKKPRLRLYQKPQPRLRLILHPPAPSPSPKKKLYIRWKRASLRNPSSEVSSALLSPLWGRGSQAGRRLTFEAEEEVLGEQEREEVAEALRDDWEGRRKWYLGLSKEQREFRAALRNGGRFVAGV